MKRLFFLVTILLLLLPALTSGQPTNGFHRVNQILQRGKSGTYAQVVPYATVYMTSTATGLAAPIYSDPLLTSIIPSSTVTSDASGNYDYYTPLNYCVDETVSSPGAGTYTTTNICGNTGVISTPVAIINGGTGQITAPLALAALGGAPINSPTFTGVVTSPSFSGPLTGAVTGNVTGNVSGTAANVTGIVAVANGGTNSATASGARANLSAAQSGVNADITSLTNLTTPLPVAEGGTGQTTASTGLAALGGLPSVSPAFTGTLSGPTINASGVVSAAGQLSGAGIRDTTIGITTAAMSQQTSAACTDITGMTWSIAASKNYVLSCEVPVTFASSATIAFCLSGPGSPISYSLNDFGPIAASAVFASYQTLAQTSWGTKTSASGAPGAATEWIHVKATIRNDATASGTPLTLQTAANGTNGITVLADASCTLVQAN